MENNNKIKILHVVPNINLSAGVENYVYNLTKHIDKNVFQIDIIHHNWRHAWFKKQNKLASDLKRDGINIYDVPDINDGYFAFRKSLKKFFKYKNYDIIHVHGIGTAYFFLKYAKKYNIPHRIYQSHESVFSENYFKKYRNKLLFFLSKKYITNYLAVSPEAGNAIFKRNKFEVMYASVDKEIFKFSESWRKSIRRKEKIKNDEKVIGFVGRITKAKNSLFLIDVFYEYFKIQNNSKLVVVGDGPEINKIKNRAEELNIENNVIFTGRIDNVNQYYSAFDLFILPSLHEGLPFVVIEAQYCGLTCLVSSNVTDKINIGLCEFYDINKSPQDWARNIECLLKNNSINNVNYKDVFNPIINAQKFAKLYKNIIIP